MIENIVSRDLEPVGRCLPEALLSAPKARLPAGCVRNSVSLDALQSRMIRDERLFCCAYRQIDFPTFCYFLRQDFEEFQDTISSAVTDG